jgi:membrane protease YdiL (CAAX protease family)
LALYGFYILSAISFSVVIYIICDWFHLKHDEIGFTQWRKVLAVFIIAPICEEVLCRGLLKFKRNNIILFSVTAIALIGYSVFRSHLSVVVYLSILLFTLLSLLAFFSRSKIELFISSNFKYFFYASAILFGLLHATNFTGNIYIIMAFSLILGSPQIVLGFILGYIRMNYGLVYSILFHMAVNASVLFSLFHK